MGGAKSSALLGWEVGGRGVGLKVVGSKEEEEEGSAQLVSWGGSS